MKFSIRKATINDMKNIFELSNQDYVRFYSFNQDKIIWEAHCQWFTKAIHNPNILFYILETDTKECIGQIRLQCTEYSSWEISISLFQQFHNQHIVSRALKQIIEQHHSLNFLATVREDNISSIHLFEALNFQKTQTTTINNKNFYLYQYTIKNK